LENKGICLFCKGDGPFNSVEHIVPASLGNDTDILIGIVCDKCQNYFGREIEGPALHKTPFAFWRTYLGVKTKRRKLPTVTLDTPETGRIPSHHSHTDVIGFTAHEDWSTSVDIDDPEIVRAIIHGDKNRFNLVLSPWHLIVMGRFIGKMGLEYVAMHDVSLATTPQFDALRKYVREGTVKSIWPLFWGHHGSLSDLKGDLLYKKGGFEQEVECYRWALGLTKDDKYIFAFAMGTDLLLICLSHSKPDPKFSKIIQGTNLECIWYPDTTW